MAWKRGVKSLELKEEIKNLDQINQEELKKKVGDTDISKFIINIDKRCKFYTGKVLKWQSQPSLSMCTFGSQACIKCSYQHFILAGGTRSKSYTSDAFS